MNYLLRKLNWRWLHALRVLVIRALIRSRCLESFRLYGHYKIAVDGTGCLVYRYKHCKHCLVKKTASGTIYYHPVLEANKSIAHRAHGRHAIEEPLSIAV